MLGEVLRRRRNSKGLTLEQVGAAFGVKPQMVSRYELGADPGIGFVAVLASLVGCSWYEIYSDLWAAERLQRMALDRALAEADAEDDKTPHST